MSVLMASAGISSGPAAFPLLRGGVGGGGGGGGCLTTQSLLWKMTSKHAP